MAVDLYSGVPGSGKSLLATYQGIEALETGVNVIANFPFDEKYFNRWYKRMRGKFLFVNTKEMTPQFFLQYASENHVRTGAKRAKVQTLVIIDEAEMKFNSRSWDSKDRMDFIYFFANHRHFNFRFILIAQNDRMLDRQIRALIQTEYKCRAIGGIGILGKVVSFLFGGLFFAVPYDHATRIRFYMPHIYRLHKKKARVYDTMALFEGMIGYKEFVEVEEKQNAKSSENPEKSEKQGLCVDGDTGVIAFERTAPDGPC